MGSRMYESDLESEVSHQMEHDDQNLSQSVVRDPLEDILEENAYEKVSKIAQYFSKTLEEAPKTNSYYNDALLAMQSIQRIAVRLKKKHCEGEGVIIKQEEDDEDDLISISSSLISRQLFIDDAKIKTLLEMDRVEEYARSISLTDSYKGKGQKKKPSKK